MPLTASPRPGSRSPQSIPSSPTSIRSASSAIFERDIEPLPTTLPLPHHSPNPHRTPRSRTTETLEQSVPSVLAEAASVLAETKDGAVADISVLAPVPSSNAPSLLSFGSPGGSRSPPTIRSRSPSPSPRPGLGARKVSGSVPTATTSPPQPLSLTSSPIPSPLIPTSSLPAAAAAASDASSPGASPRLRPSAPPSAFSPPASALLPDPTSLPSASHSKRLSFVSYSDLLTSTPVASVPLTTLTSPPPNQTPPHIPVVAAASSTAPSVLGGTSVGSPSRPLSMYSIQSAKDKRASTLISGAGDDLAMRLADDIGGEWEREGFGKGMEERLEEVGVGKA